MKTCSECKLKKPLRDFHKRAAAKDGLQSKCKSCNQAKVEGWQKSNPDKYEVIWKRNSYGDEAVLKRKASRYGLTVGELSVMFEQANGLCEICKDAPISTLVVDHCHMTNKVRGLLCHKCNTGIGLLGDSVETLQAAIKYLNR